MPLPLPTSSRFFSTRPAWSAIACILGLLLLGGCSVFGLNETEEQLLAIHKQNAKIFYENGDLPRAIQQCRKGLEIDEDDESLRLNLAFALLRQGRPESLAEAQVLFEDLPTWFEDDSQEFKIYMGLGMTLQQRARLARDDESAEEDLKGLQDEAEEYLEMALELNNESIEVLFTHAILSLDRGDEGQFLERSALVLGFLEGSHAALDTRLELTENPLEVQLLELENAVTTRRAQLLRETRADIYFKDQRYDLVIAELSGLEVLGPLSRSNHYNRALAYELEGNAEEAVRDLERFIRMNEDALSPMVEEAVQSVLRLRAQLAEQRTSSEPGTP